MQDVVFADRLFSRAIGASRGMVFSDDDLWEELYDECVACSLPGFRTLPEQQRRGVDKMYKSVARSAVDTTKAKVRDLLLRDVLKISSLPPSHRVRYLQRTLEKIGVKRQDGGVFKTLVRSHQSIATNGATWLRTIRDPAVWGYEYVTAEDERVRPAHAKMDGTRYPKRHAFWRRYVPPNGWGCRCRIRPIYREDDDASDKAYDGTPDTDPQFAFNPGLLLSGLSVR